MMEGQTYAIIAMLEKEATKEGQTYLRKRSNETRTNLCRIETVDKDTTGTFSMNEG